MTNDFTMKLQNMIEDARLKIEIIKAQEGDTQKADTTKEKIK